VSDQHPELRVSDADREATVVRLREAGGEGRLTLEELADRVEKADAARTWGDLEGGEQRKGRWRPGRRTNAIAVMGGIDIDLREAELADGAEILAIPFMGAVSVVVPEGVSVELSGFSLMGGNSGPDDKVVPLPNSPIVRVRAFSLMGGVVVERKPSRKRS
jgi:hypothetical protein